MPSGGGLPRPQTPEMAETHPAVGNQAEMPSNSVPAVADAKTDVYHVARPVQPRCLADDPAVIDLRSMPVAE